ncbi:TetR/AcrR family transcriptional regulator [Euzebya sp.]|uniref:TetR/AcrR family transcriptional regulator n=1 Tax=Euzebya sp. TaxID=1971409 RepID=UPI003513B233
MPRPPTDPPASDGARAALLAAAEAEVAEGGSAAVSLRAIARRAGVSHAAPAYHFGDKAGVLTALATEGFRRLTAAMRDAIADSDAPTPAREVQAAGMGYLRFALDNPALFDVMWRPSSLHRDDPDLRARGDDAYAILVDAIAAAQARGWGDGRDADLLAVLMWSWIHGMATLLRDGPLAEQGDAQTADTPSAEELARAVGRILIDALAAPPTG